MNRDDIIRMAREAGGLIDEVDWYFEYENLERFAALAYEAGRKDENEACADIAENWRCNGMPRTTLADQIRARREQ